MPPKKSPNKPPKEPEGGFPSTSSQITKDNHSRFIDIRGDVKHLAVSQYIMGIHDIIIKQSDNGKAKRLLIFDKKLGYYRDNGMIVINQKCVEILGEKVKLADKREIHAIIMDTCSVPDSEIDKGNIITMKNGNFNVQNFTFSPHTPNVYNTRSLPYPYDPDAKCPGIQEFMQSIVGDEISLKTLYQWLGYVFSPGYEIQEFLILHGPGHNGKGVLIHIMYELYGFANVTAIPLKLLARNQFALGRLKGKYANFCPELPNGDLETQLLKQLSAGDICSTDVKNKDGFEFLPRAKQIIALNDVPKLHIPDGGYSRRPNIVNLPFVFEGDKDKGGTYWKTLTVETELSGLFNLAIKELKDLLAMSPPRFVNWKPMGVRTSMYNLRSNHLPVFFDIYLEGVGSCKITKSDLADAYKGFCDIFRKSKGYESLITPVNHQVFKKIIEQVTGCGSGYMGTGNDKKRAWVDIRFRDIDDIADSMAELLEPFDGIKPPTKEEIVLHSQAHSGDGKQPTSKPIGTTKDRDKATLYGYDDNPPSGDDTHTIESETPPTDEHHEETESAQPEYPASGARWDKATDNNRGNITSIDITAIKAAGGDPIEIKKSKWSAIPPAIQTIIHRQYEAKRTAEEKGNREYYNAEDSDGRRGLFTKLGPVAEVEDYILLEWDDLPDHIKPSLGDVITSEIALNRIIPPKETANAGVTA